MSVTGFIVLLELSKPLGSNYHKSQDFSFTDFESQEGAR